MTAGAGMAGAGAATMPRAGGPIGVPGAEAAAEKKPIDPRLFFVGGGLLVAAVIALFTTGVLGGTSAPYPENTQTVSDPVRTDWVGTGPQTNVQPPVSSGPTNTNTNTTDPGQVQTQQQPTFSMLVAPNPAYETAAFAIAPSQAGVSPQQAASLARTARQQLTTNGKWKNTQIVVFTSADSGQAFRQYMNSRKGAPLAGGDFAALAGQGVWDSATIFYETRGKNERISEPAKNPKGWWGGR